MRFMAYYTIVNCYFNFYLIVCEKLGTCLCAHRPWCPIRFSCQVLFFTVFQPQFWKDPKQFFLIFGACFMKQLINLCFFIHEFKTSWGGSRVKNHGSQIIKKSSSFIFQESQKKQRLFRPDVSRIPSADRRGFIRLKAV